MRGGEDEPTYDKVYLLIIDPQNDFTDDPSLNDPASKLGDVFTGKEGALSVPGAMNDYVRIAKFIEKNKASITEIHVSLDTHTRMHIGNLEFWKRVDINGTELPLDRTDAVSVIKLVGDTIIGTSIVGKYDGIRTYTPANPELIPYVKQYIKNYYEKPKEMHDLVPIIWNTHCIENSKGHKIHKTITTVLDSYSYNKGKGKVRYHIKGQNNLAEMYSIFSAEQPVTDNIIGNLKNQEYISGFTSYFGIRNHDLENGANSYAQAITELNLDTSLNKAFLDYLLGSKDKPNLVIVCGEARSHCVKRSIIDMYEYQQKRELPCSNIVLLTDCSSLIPFTPGPTIIELLREAGGRNLTSEDNEIMEKILDGVSCDKTEGTDLEFVPK
jgi:nicotinamidase-related amidase